MTEFNPYAVGEVIRRLRKEKKVSQEVFSGLVGMARSHLAMIGPEPNSPILKRYGVLPTRLKYRPMSWWSRSKNKARKVETGGFFACAAESRYSVSFKKRSWLNCAGSFCAKNFKGKDSAYGGLFRSQTEKAFVVCVISPVVKDRRQRRKCSRLDRCSCPAVFLHLLQKV